MNYGDFFSDTWKAFSHHPVIHLNEYRGKTVSTIGYYYVLYEIEPQILMDSLDTYR